jgi:hypothetical protein
MKTLSGHKSIRFLPNRFKYIGLLFFIPLALYLLAYCFVFKAKVEVDYED